MFDYNSLPEKKRTLRKVQLGAGGNNSPHYINLDMRACSGVDVVCDMAIALPFGDSEIEEFYSHHVLEHFNKFEIVVLLKEVLRCLKPGGTLVSRLPNFEACFEHWKAGRHIDYVMAGIFGAHAIGWQPKEANIHAWGYSPKTMKELLVSVGFEIVKCEGVGTMSEIPVIDFTARKR